MKQGLCGAVRGTPRRLGERLERSGLCAKLRLREVAQGEGGHALRTNREVAAMAGGQSGMGSALMGESPRFSACPETRLGMQFGDRYRFIAAHPLKHGEAAPTIQGAGIYNLDPAFRSAVVTRQATLDVSRRCAG